MSSPIVHDAEGPWLPDEPGPLDPALKAELRMRLTTTKLSDEVLTKYQLRGPVLSRTVRMGVLEWVDEKAAGGGKEPDWNRPTMAKYRAILREVGPPSGDAHRQAGYANVRSIASAGSLALAGAGAAAGSPTATAVGAVLLVLIVSPRFYVMSREDLIVVVVLVLEQPAAALEPVAPLELAAAA